MIGQFHKFFNQHFWLVFSAFGPTAVPTTPWEWCAKELHCNAANSVWTKEKKNRTVVFLGQLGEILSEHSYFNFIRLTEKANKITLNFDVYSNLRFC